MFGLYRVDEVGPARNWNILSSGFDTANNRIDVAHKFYVSEKKTKNKLTQVKVTSYLHDVSYFQLQVAAGIDHNVRKAAALFRHVIFKIWRTKK